MIMLYKTFHHMVSFCFLKKLSQIAEGLIMMKSHLLIFSFCLTLLVKKSLFKKFSPFRNYIFNL